MADGSSKPEFRLVSSTWFACAVGEPGLDTVGVTGGMDTTIRATRCGPAGWLAGGAGDTAVNSILAWEAGAAHWKELGSLLDTRSYHAVSTTPLTQEISNYCGWD